MGLASALAGQAASQPSGASQAAYGAQQAYQTPSTGYSAAPGYPQAGPYPPAAGPQQMPMQQPMWGAQQHQPPSGYQQQQVSPQNQQQGMSSVVAAKLQKIVAANQLQHFYSPGRLQDVTSRITQRVDFHALAARWRMPTELAVDLAALALYDIIIYADDSGSMESENGERIDDLKLIMGKVAEVATLFDEDGIEVRFINSNKQGNGIRNAVDASRLLADLEYRWDTKLATFMEEKILKPMAYEKQLNKPLLIITITDGEPSDKPKDKIIQTIIDAKNRLSGTYGPGAVAFQFAQVGKDQEAQEFLAKLDNHPQVGKLIDCTSYYELESAEYAAKGITLSVEAWLVKLMVGAIDPEYDEQDEAPGRQQQQQPYGGAPGYGYPPSGVGYPPAGGGYPPQQQQPYGGGYPPPQQQQQPPSGYPAVQPYGGAYPPQQQQPYGSAYPPQGQQGYSADAQGGGKKKGFFDKLFS
eukprot:GHUV01001885.1.p1 GENE.GHUV01001885.1~~GHUV01001885.1.p1  ORF type:complete len:469 (+),score=162.03 GHUV01001885.1:143-1549(+)